MGKKARLKRLRQLSRPLTANDPELLDQAERFMANKPNTKVVYHSFGEKMSEIIEDFAEPLLRQAETPEEMETAIVMAASAWNFSIASQELQDKLREDLVSKFGAEVWTGVFQFLLERKQSLFPNHKRLILECKMHPTPKGLRLDVLSTLEGSVQ